MSGSKNAVDIIGVVGHPSRSKRGELLCCAYGGRAVDPLFSHAPVENSDHEPNRWRCDCENLSPRTNNDLDMKLYLRVAPELWHLTVCTKLAASSDNEMLVTLNAEPRVHLLRNSYLNFTWHLTRLRGPDRMRITEDLLLSKMVHSIFGTHKLTYHPNGTDKEPVYELDFTPPFKRINIYDELSTILGVQLPDADKLDTPEARDFFDRIATEHGVDCTQPRSCARLLDKLIGEFIEPKLINPTFLTGHPQIMSPLAKWHRSRPGLTERFELFACTKELCNAYTELNDPLRQRELFEQQAKAREAGDDEAQAVDENFCTALEYGLPPTAGWGMGIDRLTMMLTDSHNIKEVLFFPAMRPAPEGHNLLDDVEGGEEGTAAAERGGEDGKLEKGQKQQQPTNNSINKQPKQQQRQKQNKNAAAKN
ncbi:hypothetical protein niasHT_033068 [Heterodera trifolii]|uniref:Aminoacyl-transfer RNA synthetases class-II family profile domain-containing protein n=1 Tax=Heterodera trifolii TaxID=157864 RepID=A0ABD2J623_9BILA